MNQITGGDATLSRYAIWAETVRSVVLHAVEQAEEGSDAKLNLIRAANSLAAFAVIQQQLSPIRVARRPRYQALPLSTPFGQCGIPSQSGITLPHREHPWA